MEQIAQEQPKSSRESTTDYEKTLSLKKMVEAQNRAIDRTKVSREIGHSTMMPISLGVVPIYVMCPGCKKDEYMRLEKSGVCWNCDEKSRLETERIESAKRRLEAILGFKGSMEFSFEQFKIVAGTENAYNAAFAFHPDDKQLGNIYLHGVCGTGKTHLAGAIARKNIEAGRSVEIHKPTEIMRMFRRKDADEEERMLKKLAGQEVLVIDDLGVGKATEFANQILYEIIDMRINNYRNGLVITSNLSLAEFADKCGDDRLPSRIKGLCRIVPITSKRDFR